MFRNFLLIVLFFWNGCITTFPLFSSLDSLTISFDSNEENSSQSIDEDSLKLQQHECKKSLHIFIFKVGQGNFCMIKKGANAVIVDAGSHNVQHYDIVAFTDIQNIFELCLKKAKIKAIIITHADEDHYNFLSSLKEYLDSDCFFVIGGTEAHKNTILSTLSLDCDYDCKSCLSSFNLVFEGRNPSLEDSGIERKKVLVVEKRLNDLIPNGSFQFLIPLQSIKEESPKNDYSLVFKFTYGGNSILFTGDATGNTYNVYFPKTAKVAEIKKRNIAVLKEINLFVIPHHGSDTDNSPIWSDVIIKYNQTTLVGAIVSVGLDSPYSHPVSFIQNKPWPHTMLTEKSPIMAKWKQKGEDAKKISKNMHARILETWNSFGFFDFVFANNGDLLLLEKDNDKSFVWEVLIKENIPWVSYDAVKAFYDESKKELTKADRFTLNFFPRYCRKQILEHFGCMSEDSDDYEGDTGEIEENPMSFDLAMNLIAEDFNQAENNMIKIQEAITSENYFIQNVTGDGNCGFYAILQGLNPEQNYESVKQRSEQWEAAARLRRTIAGATDNENLQDMTTNAFGTEVNHLGFDALPAVARHLASLKNTPRGLVVINSTPTEQYPMYSYYDEQGEQHSVNNLNDALKNSNNPVILLFKPGHWQAVLPAR